jgi:triacylglycerol lipase
LKPLRAAERTNRVILALHGGAYIQEIQNGHYAAYADLVRRSAATIHVPIYPLAPHGTAGTVVPVVADIMSDLVSQHGPEHVSVLGDSAGAGLALAAIQELVHRGTVTPSSLVLISPWLDATLSDPRSLTIKDPMLNVEGLIAAGKYWAGDLDPVDWRVSPLFGTMAGIPRTSVYAGTLDALAPDTYRLRDLAVQAGLDISFTIEPGLIHAWAGFTILPEYHQAAPSILRDLVGASPVAR